MKNKNLAKKITILLIIICICSINFFLLASCDEKKEYFEEDKTFYIKGAESTLMGFPLNLFLNKNSSIDLRKDGTATIYARSGNGVGGILNSLVLNDPYISNFNVGEYEGMIDDYIPGFSLDDMENAIQLVKSATGITIEGIDFEEPAVAAFFDELAENGRFPSRIEDLDYIGIRYDANYHIEKIESEYTGEYTVIYMGEHNENGEPYTIMTLSTDEETEKEKLVIRFVPAKLNIVAYSE